jgi:hypothetical protein
VIQGGRTGTGDVREPVAWKMALLDISTQKRMEAAGSCRTQIPLKKAAWCYNPKD